MLLKNLGLKIIAFLLAIALWGWVLMNQQKPSASIVPVDVPPAGPAAAGYRITGVEVTPAFVAITGPEDKLGDIEAIKTPALPLKDLTSDTTLRLALICPRDVRLLEEEDKQVSVKVKVEKVR